MVGSGPDRVPPSRRRGIPPHIVFGDLVTEWVGVGGVDGVSVTGRVLEGVYGDKELVGGREDDWVAVGGGSQSNTTS